MDINNSYFTEFGRALKRGDFDKISPYSIEYEMMWQEQLQRCVYGYKVGGKYMPGSLYYYVNFHTIELIDEKTERKHGGLPKLRDVEWEVFSAIEKAKKAKKGFIWISGRRGGKSYIASGLLCHNFIFFSNSKGVVGAGDADKAKDLMLKVRAGINGLAKTEFYIPLLKDNIDDELVSGWKAKDEHNNWISKSNDRIIFNRNFKNKHTAANGLSADIFIMEEIGMFDNLIAAYNSSEPCWKEGTTNFGFPFLCGTGGDMERGSIDAQKMFEDPETYNLLSFDSTDSDTNTIYNTGFFLPGWKVLNDYKNEDGVTNELEAKKAILSKRELLQKGKDLDALFKYIQYYPLTPNEAFLSSNNNIFPIALLQHQIEMVYKTPEFSPKRGYLRWNSGGIEFIEDVLAREVDYPTKAIELSGCVTIYEEPFRHNGSIPNGLYIAGTDPYAQDSSDSSPSLGSTFIYKRIFSASQTNDLIVAEYTGRPSTSDEYHEGVRKLLVYYNAKCLYENNIPGLKQYFETKNCLHLLHGQPDIIQEIITDSLVDRKFGIHMSQKIKIFMLNQIKTWLLTEIEPGVFNLTKLYCVNLLKELINYNEKGNFDRVIAFGMCVLQDMEMFRENVDAMYDNSNNNFFDGLFKHKSLKKKDANLNRLFNL